MKLWLGWHCWCGASKNDGGEGNRNWREIEAVRGVLPQAGSAGRAWGGEMDQMCSRAGCPSYLIQSSLHGGFGGRFIALIFASLITCLDLDSHSNFCLLIIPAEPPLLLVVFVALRAPVVHPHCPLPLQATYICAVCYFTSVKRSL